MKLQSHHYIPFTIGYLFHLFSLSFPTLSKLQYFFSVEKRFLVSFLPETADHKLPDTIAEGEAMGQGDTLWKSCFKKRDKNEVEII